MVFLTSSRGGQGGQIFLGVYLWVYYAVPENLFITPHYPYLKLRFFTRNHPTYFANIDTSDSLHPSHIQTRSYTYCCQSELHSYWLVVFRFGMAWFGLVTTWIDWVLKTTENRFKTIKNHWKPQKKNQRERLNPRHHQYTLISIMDQNGSNKVFKT